MCVYCGASEAVVRRYGPVARELGRLVAREFGTLVYGGARVGLMGEVARTVHEFGGRVVGVLPDFMREREAGYLLADELITTVDMRARKAILESRSDAFIALPGGFGTLDEIVETATNETLGLHAKPLVAINVDGFYEPLKVLLARLVDDGFAQPTHRDAVLFADTPAEAVALIKGRLQTDQVG